VLHAEAVKHERIVVQPAAVPRHPRCLCASRARLARRLVDAREEEDNEEENDEARGREGAGAVVGAA